MKVLIQGGIFMHIKNAINSYNLFILHFNAV